MYERIAPPVAMKLHFSLIRRLMNSETSQQGVKQKKKLCKAIRLFLQDINYFVCAGSASAVMGFISRLRIKRIHVTITKE